MQHKVELIPIGNNDDTKYCKVSKQVILPIYNEKFRFNYFSTYQY